MFSKACKYAIRAVIYLAVESRESKKVGVAKMSEDLDIPKHFLGKLLQNLSKEGKISSTKGPNGGFYLNEENRSLNMITIVECIDGPGIFSSCILDLKSCSSENPCPFHFQVSAFREGLRHQMMQLTIQQIANRIISENIKY